MKYTTEKLQNEIRKLYADNMSRIDWHDMIVEQAEVFARYAEKINSCYDSGEYEEENGFYEREDLVRECWQALQ